MHAQLRRRRAPEAVRLRAAHRDDARHRLGRVFRAEGAVLAEQEAEVAAHFLSVVSALVAVAVRVLLQLSQRVRVFTVGGSAEQI